MQVGIITKGNIRSWFFCGYDIHRKTRKGKLVLVHFKDNTKVISDVKMDLEYAQKAYLEWRYEDND